MIATTYHHIQLDQLGIPWIADTQVKVAEVVLDQLAHAWDAEEIHRQHPNLTLSQIHSALAYYHDHRDAIDKDIEDRIRREEQFFRDNPPAATIREKLLRAKSAR